MTDNFESLIHRCYFCRDIIPEEDYNLSWFCRKCQKQEQQREQHYAEKEESQYAQRLEEFRNYNRNQPEGCLVFDPDVTTGESSWALQRINQRQWQERQQQK